MKRTILWKGDKKVSKQQINFHMNIYKTHDLLNTLDPEFVVQRLKK